MNINTEQYFSTVPQIHAPRSVFDRSYTMKTTMNVNYLYPIFVDEALPGDSFKLSFQAFGRILNPLVVPVMDELYFETLWFKCPNRLVWSHWVNFCGEQDNPNDSTDYIIPTINSGNNGFSVDSIADHFGIPTGVANGDVNSLPFRAYNLIYNQWFRDENLVNSVTVPLGDSDSSSNYTLLKSAKIHDYFTSCLPFAQKGDVVHLPLGESAPIIGNSEIKFTTTTLTSPVGLLLNGRSFNGSTIGTNVGNAHIVQVNAGSNSINNSEELKYNSGLAVDLSNSVGASIADFRFAMKLQDYRERCARGGTRYIEWIKQMFNVDSPDARLQRTEFLGSTREMIDINTVIQTSSTDNTSAQGHLSAYGVISHHGAGFSTSFTEHSYIIGLARIRHNPVYQQGLDRMWSRKTLIDFYNPVFNGLSEQPVKNSEIYWQGKNVAGTTQDYADDEAFGFNEAWADYRFKTSKICGLLRSGSSNLALDCFHLAQSFSQLPVLNQSFIEENVPMDRVIALPNNQVTYPQFIFDFRFNLECARPMPIRNIPATLYDRI